MGLADYEVFIRERLNVWDETLDVSEGSPIDRQVIQPLLRRLGTDPFTVDMSTFIVDRLTQEFPDLAATDGDAVSDLLAKPAMLLWDPLIREIQRVKNMLSFRDPASLTLDEAEALGANIFAERDRGNYARGIARLYYAQGQHARISQANFFTSRSGLHYFPEGVQSIRLEEMLLNIEGELYYFDVNVVAEKPGDEYNIGPNELVTVANVPAATRVVNKNRFRFGLPEEDSVAFAARIEQDLTERSLVGLRGINAKLTRSFPEVTRLAVVGFQDPEMQRDVISGGSLGPVLAGGTDAATQPDGEFKTTTRRVYIPSATFLTDIGPTGPSTGYVLTLFGMFGASPPSVRDLAVIRVVSDTIVEVAEQVLVPSSGKPWCLRKNEITLSAIPGGIVLPENQNGTTSVKPDEVHIGGCTDIVVRGADFDTATLVIDTVADDAPLLEGLEATIAGTGVVSLEDLALNIDYQEGDDTYEALEDAELEQYTFEILDGVAAGAYRILGVTHAAGAAPELTLDPTPLTPSGSFRWRLLNDIEIDLVEPKETRIAGSNGVSVQNQDYFSTLDSVDFDALGVSVGDILRVENGSVAGDYVVEEIPAPLFTKVRLDRDFTASQSGLKFSIFRANSVGGVKRPLVRITSIDLLDATGQTVGTTIPYAKPIDVQSRAFQNPGIGEKVSSTVAQLGIVSLPQPTLGFSFGVGDTLALTWDDGSVTVSTSVTGLQTAAQVRDALNAASQAAISQDIAGILNYNGEDYVGIIPVGPNTRTAPCTGHTVLFGDATVRTSRDVRASDVASWAAVTPAIDEDLDALWVQDGFQSGFFSTLTMGYTVFGLSASTALRVESDFSPEIFRSVRVGARSLGSARVYFLEPTSMEIDQETRFLLETENGTELSFKPDPTLRFQKIPALPNATKPKNGVTTGGTYNFTSGGLDFVKKGIRPGDILVIDYVPVTGTVSLSETVAGVALKDLRISLDNQPDKIITFVNDVATPGAVSRDGIAEQINNAVGLSIATIEEVSTGDFRLRFNPEMLLIIRQQSTSPSTANTLLGFSNIADTNNKSPNAGKDFVIDQVGAPTADAVTVTTENGAFATSLNQQFKILRQGGQRICSTQMAENVAEAGLYYWDVELVSEGVGDLWNIDAEQALIVEKYRSDGYYLTTEDANLSFSPVEKIELHLSRSILEVGVDDDPENATQITGQSISINYEYSSLIGNVQSFVSSDVERVVNQSPLVRHLIPHFVRMDLSYVGGPRASDLTPDLQRYVREVEPGDALEAGDIQDLARRRGATGVTNPIDLLAVVHNFDRTITLARSQDALTTGRLAAFIPDVLNVTRRAAG